MNERELWDLKFSIEVSTLYHDWRRAALWTVVRLVRTITLGAAVITLITAFSSLHITLAVTIIASVSSLSAIVSLWDLVENFSAAAQQHESLYQRFRSLQAQIERYNNDPESHMSDWKAEENSIRVDEPPTLWAVYARAWNQAIDRHAIERKGYYRKIPLWRSLFGYVFHFNPQDFPAAQSQ